MSLCTLIGTVVAKDETREELRKILAGQVAPTRAEPGCVNYDFHVDARTRTFSSSMRTGGAGPISTRT